MSFVFSNSISTFVSFISSITAGTHVLNTKVQREYTKLYKWKCDLIFYMMWVNEVPGKIYFHPVERNDGIIIQESLDGKSRTSAAVEFMNDVFKLNNEFQIKGYEHLYGKYFSEFTPADQHRFKTTKVSIADANRTLSDDETNVFFILIKTPSNCKTGEGLHSDLESPNRTMLDHKMDTDVIFKEFITTVWGKDSTFPYYTAIASCMMYHEYGPNRIMSGKQLSNYWRRGVSKTVFDEVIKNMQKVWDIKKKYGTNIKRIESVSVFCPFFMLYSNTISDEKIKKILDKWNVTNQFGKIVGGSHTSVKTRYEILLKMID